MTDLDQLLNMICWERDLYDYEKPDFDSLYKKIQEAIEKAEKYDNLIDLFKEYNGGLHKFIDDYFCGRIENKSLSEDLELKNRTIEAFDNRLKEKEEENARLKEKIDILENNRAHIPELAFRNGKAYCKKCGSDLE